jgi:DNA invertase Pin-like site-specific DNA recombinase
LVRTDIQQHSSENQQRLNRQTARAFGLKLKPGYDFSEPGKSASKPITRRELERGINAIVKEKAVEALLVSSVDRLSRLGMRHVGEMLDAVDAVGGRIIFNKGNLDSSQPASRAIIAFLSEQARDEANMLSWRIETWREGCRLKGKWTGRFRTDSRSLMASWLRIFKRPRSSGVSSPSSSADRRWCESPKASMRTASRRPPQPRLPICALQDESPEPDLIRRGASPR